MIIQQNETKWCPRCKDTLSINDFNKKPNGRPRWCCRKCEAKKQKEWRKANPEKNREIRKRYTEAHPEMMKRWYRRSKLRRKGMDPDAIEKYLLTHNGNCEICGLPPNGHRHYIDHSHTTGKFRGILCAKCNSGLGLFNDSPELLDKAKIYLFRN